MKRAHGRLLGGLEHHRVARHERGRQLPRRDRHREVPGRDESDDAHRPALRVHLARGQGLAVYLAAREPPVCREVPQRRLQPRGLAAGFPQRLARLARHLERDVLRALARQLGRGEEHRRPLGAAARRPGREGGPCGVGGGLHVRPARVREGTQELGRRSRVRTVVRPAAGRRHPLAGDQVVRQTRLRSSTARPSRQRLSHERRPVTRPSVSLPWDRRPRPPAVCRCRRHRGTRRPRSPRRRGRTRPARGVRRFPSGWSTGVRVRSVTPRARRTAATRRPL